MIRRLEHTLPHSSSVNSSHMPTPAGSCLHQTPPWGHAHLCWECRHCSLFTSVVKACMIVLWWEKNNIMLPRMWSFILAEPSCKKLTYIMQSRHGHNLHNTSDAPCYFLATSASAAAMTKFMVFFFQFKIKVHRTFMLQSEPNPQSINCPKDPIQSKQFTQAMENLLVSSEVRALPT